MSAEELERQIADIEHKSRSQSGVGGRDQGSSSAHQVRRSENEALSTPVHQALCTGEVAEWMAAVKILWLQSATQAQF